jgi:hypothetical protein
MAYYAPVEGFDEWMVKASSRDFVLGLDLGQAQDPTALAIIQCTKEPDARPQQRFPSADEVPWRQRLSLRHLERMPLNMGYVDQAKSVVRTMFTAPLTQAGTLVVDATGVGRPVVDLFRKQGLRPIAVSITAGEGWSGAGYDYRVSKLLLVSRLQALLHAGELKIAADMPETPALISELQDFRATYTEAGNATFGARVGRHDDLVLATAIASWYAIHRLSRRMLTARIVGNY